MVLRVVSIFLNSTSKGLSLFFFFIFAMYMLSTVSRSELTNAGIINFSPATDSARHSVQIVLTSHVFCKHSNGERARINCRLFAEGCHLTS